MSNFRLKFLVSLFLFSVPHAVSAITATKRVEVMRALECVQQIGSLMAQVDPLKDFPTEPGKYQHVKASEVQLQGRGQVVRFDEKPLENTPCSARMLYLTHPDDEETNLTHHAVTNDLSAGEPRGEFEEPFVLAYMGYTPNRIPLDPLQYRSGSSWKYSLRVETCEVNPDGVDAHFIQNMHEKPVHQKLSIRFRGNQLVSYMTTLHYEDRGWFSTRFVPLLKFSCSSIKE